MLRIHLNKPIFHYLYVDDLVAVVVVELKALGVEEGLPALQQLRLRGRAQAQLATVRGHRRRQLPHVHYKKNNIKFFNNYF